MLAVRKRLRKGLDSTEANLNLSLNGAIIEQVKSHKLSGIHINQDLHFDAQSDALCKSLSKKIGLLKYISAQLKRSHKELCYDAVLKPSFLHGSSVWSSTNKANLDSILRLQKRAGRVILNAPFNSRSVDLFNTLNWISFYRDSHIIKGCALIHKKLKENTPNYMNEIELLVTNSSLHMRNTRYSNLSLLCPRYIMPRRVVVLLQFVLLRIGTLFQDL